MCNTKKRFLKSFFAFSKTLHLHEYFFGYFRVSGITAYDQLKAWNMEKKGIFDEKNAVSEGRPPPP